MAISFNATLFPSLEFIIDSGASHHVITSNEQFINYRALSNKYLATASSRVKISGVGDIKLGNVGTLRNVLYVPQATANLLSVRQIVQDGHAVIFSKEKVILRQRTGIEIVLGKSQIIFTF